MSLEHKNDDIHHSAFTPLARQSELSKGTSITWIVGFQVRFTFYFQKLYSQIYIFAQL